MLDFIAVFFAVFLAELGDKTQLATLLFAADTQRPALLVFAASAAALVLSSAFAVLLGNFGARYLEAVPLRLIVGIGFVALGAWSIFSHFRGA